MKDLIYFYQGDFCENFICDRVTKDISKLVKTSHFKNCLNDMYLAFSIEHDEEKHFCERTNNFF